MQYHMRPAASVACGALQAVTAGVCSLQKASMTDGAAKAPFAVHVPASIAGCAVLQRVKTQAHPHMHTHTHISVCVSYTQWEGVIM